MALIYRSISGPDIDICLEPPLYQHLLYTRDWVVVEGPFALFDKVREMVFGDAVITAQIAPGLVSEILDAVHLVDPRDAALRYINHIIAPERLDVDMLSDLILAHMIGISLSEQVFGTIVL